MGSSHHWTPTGICTGNYAPLGSSHHWTPSDTRHVAPDASHHQALLFPTGHQEYSRHTSLFIGTILIWVPQKMGPVWQPPNPDFGTQLQRSLQLRLCCKHEKGNTPAMIPSSISPWLFFPQNLHYYLLCSSSLCLAAVPGVPTKTILGGAQTGHRQAGGWNFHCLSPHRSHHQ